MEGGLDTDEAKTHSKRTKEQAQAKNRNKNNTFQSDTPAGRRITHQQHTYREHADPSWVSEISNSGPGRLTPNTSLANVQALAREDGIDVQLQVSLGRVECVGAEFCWIFQILESVWLRLRTEILLVESGER